MSSSSDDLLKEIAFPGPKLGIRLNENAITWVSEASKTLGARVGMKMIKIEGINVSGMRQEEAINVIKAHTKRPLHVIFEIPRTKSTSASLPKSTIPAVTRSGSWEIVEEADGAPKTVSSESESEKSSPSSEKIQTTNQSTSSDAASDAAPAPTKVSGKEREEEETAADPADVTFMTNALRKLRAQRKSGDLNDKDYQQTVASLGMSASVVREAEAVLEAERKAAAEKAEEEAAAFEEVRVRQLTEIQRSLVFPKDVETVQILEDDGDDKKLPSHRRRRRLVLQGEIERFRKSHSVFVSPLRDMYLFLLSDMLLVTDRKKSLFKKGKKKKKKEMFSVTYEVAEIIPLDQVGIVTLNDLAYLNEKDSDRMFSVQSPVREHRFVAQDCATKKKWLDALKTQLLELTSTDVINSMIGYEHMVVNGTFFSSCMIGRADILKKLVAMLPKADAATTSMVAKDFPVNAFDSQGFTALHYAAHTGNVPCTRILCAYPHVLKDLASKRPQHDMPIHMTAMKEHAECTKLLLESGATASVRDAQGRTPLDLVVYKAVAQPSKDHSSHRCVRIILSHRGSALLNSSRASAKKTAHSTLSNSDPLGMFRDINTGDSILMCVAAKGAHQAGAHHVASALIDAGAAVNQRRARGGQTSLHLACANPRNPPAPGILATLLRAGAEPNLVDQEHNTPLHYMFMSRINEWVAARAKGKTFVPTALRPPKGVQDVHLWEQARKTAIQTLLSYGARLDVENCRKCMVKQILTAEELSLFEKIYANWQVQTPPSHTKEIDCLRTVGALVAREDKHVDDGESSRCQLCGLTFSTFTRRHHCRATGLLVCWYCSTKSFPLIREGGGRDSPQTTQAEKVTDGQFNKLLWDASKWTRVSSAGKLSKKTEEEDKTIATVSSEAQSKTVSASAMRDEMRSAAGGVGDKATTKNVEKRDPKAAKVTSSAGGAEANVAKALKTVSERTEKLNETVLAAEELANSADEFENMAKLLAEREDKKFFGLGKFF